MVKGFLYCLTISLITLLRKVTNVIANQSHHDYCPISRNNNSHSGLIVYHYPTIYHDAPTAFDMIAPPKQLAREHYEAKYLHCDLRQSTQDIKIKCPINESCPISKENIYTSMSLQRWPASVEAFYHLVTSKHIAAGRLSRDNTSPATIKPIVRLVILGGSFTQGSNVNCGCLCTQVVDGRCPPLQQQPGQRNNLKGCETRVCSWQWHLTAWIQRKYPHVEFKVYDLSTSGVNSKVQSETFGSQLPSLSKEDFVFVDQSVNDAASNILDVKIGFETLIRRLFYFARGEHPTIIVIDQYPYPQDLPWNPKRHARHWPPSEKLVSKDYATVYQQVSRHYSALHWSLREIYWTNPRYAKTQQPHLSPEEHKRRGVYLLDPMGFFHQSTHPPWFVHMFMADVLAACFLRTIHEVERQLFRRTAAASPATSPTRQSPTMTTTTTTTTSAAANSNSGRNITAVAGHSSTVITTISTDTAGIQFLNIEDNKTATAMAREDQPHDAHLPKPLYPVELTSLIADSTISQTSSSGNSSSSIYENMNNSSNKSKFSGVDVKDAGTYGMCSRAPGSTLLSAHSRDVAFTPTDLGAFEAQTGVGWRQYIDYHNVAGWMINDLSDAHQRNLSFPFSLTSAKLMGEASVLAHFQRLMLKVVFLESYQGMGVVEVRICGDNQFIPGRKNAGRLDGLYRDHKKYHVSVPQVYIFHLNDDKSTIQRCVNHVRSQMMQQQRQIDKHRGSSKSSSSSGSSSVANSSHHNFEAFNSVDVIYTPEAHPAPVRGHQKFKLISVELCRQF